MIQIRRWYFLANAIDKILSVGINSLLLIESLQWHFVNLQLTHLIAEVQRHSVTS